MSLSHSKSREITASRRRFLQSTLTSLGVLSVLASTERSLVVQEGPIESSQKTRAKGYRETDHVRRYYDTARM